MDKVYYIYNLKLNVRGDMDMKDAILNEVKKELNWRERIIVKLLLLLSPKDKLSTK